MSPYPLQIALAVLIAGLIALVAYRLKLLSKNGAVAAFGLGTVVFGLGGLRWAIVLMVFFLSSSGLSRLFHKRKDDAEKNYAKGTTRDAWQVLANGGLAGLLVILHSFFPGSPLPWIGFCAAFAAATADTWATEIGALSHAQPRLITTLKPVETGTSGAVSWLGIVATFIGALLIALVGTLFDPYASVQPAQLSLIAITIGGFIGSLVDSWLGATWQAIYYCPKCQKETERTPLHSCGTETKLEKGKAWLNNDVVNGLCTTAGTVSAILIILSAGV